MVAVSRPLASAILAGGLAFGIRLICGQFIPTLPRLLLESTVLLVTFYGVLLFVAGQRSLYQDVFKELLGPLSVAERI
jgi:hypothetical protein